MQTIKVNRVELLEKLRTNKTKHEELHKQAMEGFRVKASAELKKMLDEAENGKTIRLYVNLVEPVNQSKDYEKVIAMLEMSVDETIVVSQQEFTQYVLDEWGWKHQFNATNAVYLSG